MSEIYDRFLRECKHFFHVVSNIRPIVWISLYVAYIPLFALFYYLIPHAEFRIPEGGLDNYGAWVYYSIVTLTTLGFGDYTPMGPMAQTVTAVEVMMGMLTIGFFLNAVGSMKSEIDVESEKERQRRLHNIAQQDKLIRSVPVIIYRLNLFLAYCYAVTTRKSKQTDKGKFNPNFTLDDLEDMNLPINIPEDTSGRPAIEGFLKCTASTCLFLDQLQGRVEMSLWPELLDDCFAFVANYQMLSPVAPHAKPYNELAHFIRTDAGLARKIEIALTEIASSQKKLEN